MMEKQAWKIFALTLLVILILTFLIIIVGWAELAKEERQTKECYYEVCGEYENAILEEGVCFCYDYDILGELKIAYTEILE